MFKFANIKTADGERHHRSKFCSYTIIMRRLLQHFAFEKFANKKADVFYAKSHKLSKNFRQLLRLSFATRKTSRFYFNQARLARQRQIFYDSIYRLYIPIS